MLRRRVVFLFALVVAAQIAISASVAAQPARALLVLGDSISAGYGLPAGASWVDLLAKRIASGHPGYRVVNASISGDTTAGGRARLPALLKQHRPAIVIVELGGNDGLRGGDLSATRLNLDAIIAMSQRAGAKVLIAAMRMPPNYGPAYVRQFDELYTSIAHDRQAALVPFLFEGFAERSQMFQPDRIHPTVAAQRMILDNVWPHLVALLK